jgi:subtilisin family serine protease
VTVLPPEWQKVRLDCGKASLRSARFGIPGDGAAVRIAVRAFIDCIRFTLLGQSVCERDLWRVAQPASGAARLAQATGPPAGGTAPLLGQDALRKIALPAALAAERLRPVVVAVVDSGLDYAHPYLRPQSIWRNPSPGADPAFPGDLLGWNFLDGDNQVWDDFGHGTFVAGLVAAVNPAAQIMPLKVLDRFGGGPASAVGRAIVYAADRGARIVNLSLGSQGLTRAEQSAVDYARGRGALVVVAAGNEGVDVKGFGPAGLRGLLAVAATDAADRRAGFGNWGQQIGLAAPGVDLVSLRARRSDFILVDTGGKDYLPGANVVGAERWLFRASGTSFAAPLVAAAASLLMSRDPALTAEQVERMLVQSADDVAVPGWDQFTGAGRLNVARALRADPAYHLTARISQVAPAQERGTIVIKVFGTALGSRLARYEVQVGAGADPTRWKTIVTERGRAVEDDLLATLPAREFGPGKWVIRLLAHDASRTTREARATLDVE